MTLSLVSSNSNCTSSLVILIKTTEMVQLFLVQSLPSLNKNGNPSKTLRIRSHTLTVMSQQTSIEFEQIGKAATMDRPIVVNSMLCFIHNFRSHPQIEYLARSYFSKCVVDVATQTLHKILGTSAESDDELSSDCMDIVSLLHLFDKTALLDPTPIFVTADLTNLPVVLIGEPNHAKSVLDEIHQLRFFIQSVLPVNEQFHSYKKLSSCYGSTLNTCEKELDRVSPINLSTSSRQTPSIRDASPPQSVQLEVAEMSQAASPVSSVSIASRKVTRKHAPYRLDKAVRKLTDRLVAKKEETIEPTTPLAEPNDASTTEQAEVMNKEDEDVSQTPTSDVMIQAPSSLSSDMLLASNLLNVSSAISSPSFDNFTLMMLKNMTNQQLTSQTTKHYDGNDIDAISVEPINGDDYEDSDKMSNESSPTPSDSSNGKEYKNGYEKDSDKPYVCTQLNCTKRFANKFLLKKHQFIHTGQRPHICPHCSKCFNRKDNLLRHKKTHVANGTLNLDGRRRHHALLSPVTLTMANSFDTC